VTCRVFGGADSGAWELKFLSSQWGTNAGRRRRDEEGRWKGRQNLMILVTEGKSTNQARLTSARMPLTPHPFSALIRFSTIQKLQGSMCPDRRYRMVLFDAGSLETHAGGEGTAKISCPATQESGDVFGKSNPLPGSGIDDIINFTFFVQRSLRGFDFLFSAGELLFFPDNTP
jgi:hypothetical protein